MKLYIKNMVCDRCKMVVENEIKEAGLHTVSVSLGAVSLKEEALSSGQLQEIRQRLLRNGFELIEDKEAQVVEQIKTLVIELIHGKNDDSRIKHSEYLAQHTGREYPYLSKLFSEAEGTTIEQYIILQKIEKVRELLTYGDQTVSEIAWQMGYSSLAALSTQFKKVTGMTPSEYKASDIKIRRSLDDLGKPKQ